MQEYRMEELFSMLGYDHTTLTVNEPVDVIHKNAEVLSINLSTGQKEWKRINKIVRKEATNGYLIRSSNSDQSLSLLCSGEHRIAVAPAPTLDKIIFLEVATLFTTKYQYLAYTLDGFVNIVIQKLDKTIEILDIEVDETHSYFTDGFLSHNTFYGNPEVTSGGNALAFYATQRIKVSRGEQLKDGDNVLGNAITAHVVKNKVAAPFKKAFFEIKFGSGIDKEKDAVNMAAELGIIVRSGAWYSYNGEQIGQGLDNSLEYIRTHNLVPEIRTKVLEALRSVPKVPTEPSQDTEG